MSFRLFVVPITIGAACAMGGWFGTWFIGDLCVRYLEDPSKTTFLGEGVVIAVAAYLVTILFGIGGFAATMIWLTRPGRREHEQPNAAN